MLISGHPATLYMQLQQCKETGSGLAQHQETFFQARRYRHDQFRSKRFTCASWCSDSCSRNLLPFSVIIAKSMVSKTSPSTSESNVAFKTKNLMTPDNMCVNIPKKDSILQDLKIIVLLFMSVQHWINNPFIKFTPTHAPSLPSSFPPPPLLSRTYPSCCLPVEILPSDHFSCAQWQVF